MSDALVKVLHVVGARPNFIKIAPIMAEMARYPDRFEQVLVHTGQHYDDEMSQVFFDDLAIPRPDVNLLSGVGSYSHAIQTAQVMIVFEGVLLQHKPHLVLVVGDVNSTLAAALVSAKLGFPVAHVEAGLRSFDRTMPEEINRVLTDQIADLLFTTERDAAVNLRNEGISYDKIFFVGNVMIDTLRKHLARAVAMNTPARFGLEPRQYMLLTLHRPSNVDKREVLSSLLSTVASIGLVPVLFPAHPRTAKRIEEFGLAGLVDTVAPLGYLEFLDLMAHARLVLTDSGGIQEETTILGVPCLTLRENTERPVTVDCGTNTLVGTDPQRIVREARRILLAGGKTWHAPELWDGRAAERIVEVLLR